MTPLFQINNKILNAIVDISQKIGRLQFHYERDLHLRKENRIRSIQSSLAIENNSLTLEQVTAIINGKAVLGDPKEIREVKNAYDAYAEILHFNPYSLDDFLKAHALLTAGLVQHSGQFRQKDVGIYNASGQLVHMGARPQFVPTLMAQLFAWAERDDTPLLVKSAVLHYEIEMIHPFEDGNGRMGRLWQSVLLTRFNPLFAWLPVETMVYAHQQGYYHALATADSENDSTPFIEFMLEMISQSLDQYRDVSDKTLILSDKMSDKLVKMSDKQQAVFQKILPFLQDNSLASAELQVITGLRPATLRRYLQEFTQARLLIATGERKSRQYHLAPQ